MEIANILKTLWRYRRLVIVGAVMAVVLAYATAFKLALPPTFESRSIEFGAASTQVLIDGSSAPLVDLAQEIGPLATRAQVYARLVDSEPVQAAIAKEAGVSPDELVIASQTPSSGTRSSREAPAEQRAAEVAEQGVARRILFTAEEDLPVISVWSQSATAEEAVKLADAGALGLMKYLKSLEPADTTRAESLVTFSQLGGARGGLVNPGASKAVAAMAFIGVLGLWCVLVVLFSGVVEAMRQPGPRTAHAAPYAVEFNPADPLEMDPHRGAADRGGHAAPARSFDVA